ncbi:MAG: hypothetical protein NT081_08455 [Actinobacteria bacterium]|nr:hypothetical protein [Actinomycetota bacterium]
MDSDPTPIRMTHNCVASPSRLRHLVVVAIGLLTLLVGCSSGTSSSSDQAPTETSIPSRVDPPTYVNPAVPISTAVGREFAIMLPADPGSGWRWVLAPIDNSRLIALGSGFSDDAELIAKAEVATATTTTTPPTTRFNAAAASSTTTTTTLAVLPLVQIISFAGRSIGPATLSFRYTQIAGQPQAENKVLTFVVQVVPEAPTTTR